MNYWKLNENQLLTSYQTKVVCHLQAYSFLKLIKDDQFHRRTSNVLIGNAKGQSHNWWNNTEMKWYYSIVPQTMVRWSHNCLKKKECELLLAAVKGIVGLFFLRRDLIVLHLYVLVALH